MPTITFQDQQIQSYGGSLLDALESAGIAIPCSCRTGHCRSCLVQLKSGNPSEAAQIGLNTRQKKLNYLLTCKYFPENDIEIELLDSESRVPAQVIDKVAIHERILRVRLAIDADWQAGQYITLWRTLLEGRVYSIASRPEEGFIECHLRRRNGFVSGWIEHDIKVGDQIEVSIPQGDCFYSPAMPKQPMLMIGMGTGLAAIYGILKQAIADGHHGEIHLYPVVREEEHFYLLDELYRLADKTPFLHVTPWVKCPPEDCVTENCGELRNKLEKLHPNLKGHLIYLCGNSDTVDKLQQWCFMNGANDGDIFTDCF